MLSWICVICSSLNTFSSVSDHPSIVSVTSLMGMSSSSACLVWGMFTAPSDFFIFSTFQILRVACLYACFWCNHVQGDVIQTQRKNLLAKLIQFWNQVTEAFSSLLAMKWNNRSKFQIKNHASLSRNFPQTLKGMHP